MLFINGRYLGQIIAFEDIVFTDDDGEPAHMSVPIVWMCGVFNTPTGKEYQGFMWDYPSGLCKTVEAVCPD